MKRSRSGNQLKPTDQLAFLKSLSLPKRSAQKRRALQDHESQDHDKKQSDSKDDSSLQIPLFKKLDRMFVSNPSNLVIQNSISANSINSVCQNRKYMQSYDRTFSNVLEPELDSTDQNDSGRCWIFAVLNAVRHKMIGQYDLEDNFEFSQCYLSFWHKLEKCNHTINEIIRNRHLPNFLGDHYIRSILDNPICDGGTWITCKNLIKKYGLVPLSVFDESFNSSNTSEMNYILEYKLRQFAQELYHTRTDDECYAKKRLMIATIYNMMCKLFGSPLLPDADFNWTYCIDMNKDLAKNIERQKQRQETKVYQNLELKKSVTTNALNYYQHQVPFNCDNWIQLTNDPRNPYHKCYTSEKPDTVYEGERPIYINLPIDDIIQATLQSVQDNSPAIVMCDVGKHFNLLEGVLDTNCFNYESVFNTKFDLMDKKTRIQFRESRATHAMMIVGVDLDSDGQPVKWKIENSWGILGNLIMSNNWFKEFVFEIIIDQKYLDPRILQVYMSEKLQPTVLKYDDPMV